MYYINPNIKNLYRTSYGESRKNFIRLDMNENPEGMPRHFFSKVMDSISPEEVAMYPEMDGLIKKLANYLNCEEMQICITNGSDDAIRLMFEVFGEPGKKVVSVSPSFEMYAVYMKMYGMVHSPIAYDDKFNVNLNNVLSAIDSDTGIVVLLNPNSPIGTTWIEADVRAIIQKARENHAIVVIDEAYFYYSPHTYLHFVNSYDNVMIFRTFSKMLSIAGCRIGYIVSNGDHILQIKKASSTYPVNCFAIKFAEHILDNSWIIDELIEREKKGREYLLTQLDKSKYEYHYNQGNYVLIKSKKKSEQIFKELKENKILIKTYSTKVLSDWIRVTTGGVEIMQEFWRRFEEAEQSCNE